MDQYYGGNFRQIIIFLLSCGAEKATQYPSMIHKKWLFKKLYTTVNHNILKYPSYHFGFRWTRTKVIFADPSILKGNQTNPGMWPNVGSKQQSSEGEMESQVWNGK